MKKLFFFILLICGLKASAQTPFEYTRTSPFLTPADSRLRAILTFGLPVTNDTTLNGGLDSLGSEIYSKLYGAVFYRDTISGGGHKWTRFSSGNTAISSLNGLTASIQLFAVGSAGSVPNIVSTGNTHTFNFPIANASNTGVLQPSDFISFKAKVNSSDTAAMLNGYVQNVVLNLPTSTFSTPNVFSVSGHIASGTVTLKTQSNNTFFAGPSSGGVGAVLWRSLVNADLPLTGVTPGAYTNSNVTVNAQGVITNITNGSGGGGGGTVSFVGMTVPSAFAVSPSSITTSGTFAITAIGSSGQYINGAGGLTVFPNIPAQVNLIAGSGMAITGTYPNLTLTVTGSGGTVTTVSIGNLSPIFTASVATATTTPAISFALTNASAYTILGNNTASGAAPTYFTPSLTSAMFQNEGTTVTVLHGNAAGNLTFAAVSLVNDVTGNLGVNHLNSGTGATSSTFWRGDGTWAAVSGSGTVTSVGVVSTDLSVSGSPVTGSGNITLNVNSNAVTYAKIQQVAANRLLGNPTGSTANVSEIQLGIGLTFSGGKLAVDTANFKDTTFIGYKGRPGDSLMFISSDTLYSPRLRDSLSFHHTINPDGSWTLYATGGSLTLQQAITNSSALTGANLITTGSGASQLSFSGTNPVYFQNGILTYGLNIDFVRQTSNYLLTKTDNFIEADPSGGSLTMTLPLGNVQGQIYTIKKADNGANTVTIVVSGGTATIDGLTSYVLTNAQQSVSLIARGNNNYDLWAKEGSGGGGGGIGVDSVITITSGTSSTVTNGYNVVRFNPASTISTYTLTLPTTWHTDNDLLISFGGTITTGNVVTTLTIVNGSGQTLLQSVAPNTASAGEIIRYHLISGIVDQRTN